MEGLFQRTHLTGIRELYAYCERDEQHKDWLKLFNKFHDCFIWIDCWKLFLHRYSFWQHHGNATIRVLADTGEHIKENVPAIGSTFGVANNDNEVEEEPWRFWVDSWKDVAVCRIIHRRDLYSC